LRSRELRRAMLLALSKEAATKEDIEGLKKATKAEIEGLKRDVEATKEDVEKLATELKSYVDARIGEVNTRIGDLYGVVKASIVAIVVTLASTILVPLLLRILF
jgi:cell division septum initiation protein DivIVA